MLNGCIKNYCIIKPGIQQNLKRNFWHGQLMSAYTVCPSLLVGQTMTIKTRLQLTMPSNIVNKISCLDSAIIMYLISILVVQLLFHVVVTIFSIAVVLTQYYSISKLSLWVYFITVATTTPVCCNISILLMLLQLQ